MTTSGNDRIERSFGLWESPLTPLAMGARTRLVEALWDDDGQTLVWLESRSDQTHLLARTGSEAPRELATGVRAKLFYGGGDFGVGGGLVVFVDAKSGRLMRQRLRGPGSLAAETLTPPFGLAATPRIEKAGRFVVFLHQDEKQVDRIAAVDIAGKQWPRILVEGADFYAHPRLSPDGRWLAYLAWDHPRMPWDGTELFVMPLIHDADGLPRAGGVPRRLAGGTEVAVFQPEFTPDGATLVYVSDETGLGQLCEVELETGRTRAITRGATEFGWPMWLQEMRTYAMGEGGRKLYAAAFERGAMRLTEIDRASGAAVPVQGAEEYADISQIAAVSGKNGTRLSFLGSAPHLTTRLVTVDIGTGAKGVATVVSRTSGETLSKGELSTPEPLTWRTTGAQESHGLYYPPASARYSASGKPPLVVVVHGGPTSVATAAYTPWAQFLATRGYGVLYVNHRGSTGFGRQFMLGLRRNWGVVDVEDAVSGMRHLVDAGRADPARTVIMGASAGGFTVLQTMVTHPEAFTAGVALYGVANQFTLVEDTHKFEARYTDQLIGRLPEDAALYRERSPLFHAHKLKRPLAIFQGEEDKVVPKEQAATLVSALQRNGVPHVYHLYNGEGHGWRKTETIEHFYGALDAFLRQYVVYV